MIEPMIAKQLFAPEVHQQLIEFLDQRVPMMNLGIDSDQFVRRYAHNVPFFVAIHQQLVGLACDIFGESVQPSYSFLSMYEDGGICPLHVDRPQCRYTIDYLIRQDQPEPWPIRIGELMSDSERQVIDMLNGAFPNTDETINGIIERTKWHEAELAPNDAICYSGTHSWHYRPLRLKGTADLVFFHFVPKDFDGALN